MKAMVTGAAGFLGYHLARRLLARGDSVAMVDNFTRGEPDDAYRELCAHPRATAFEIDLNDPAAAAALPVDVEVLFHLAALNGTQNFYEHPLDVLRNSTLPTFTLLERFKGTRLRRFVYAGSSESYAGTVTLFHWPVPTAEDVPLTIGDVRNPRWSYAASKLHGEVLTAQGCGELGLPYTVLRYHNAYGPRMGDKHVLPDFLTRARDGILALYGHEETRSFLYVDDAVDATIALADCEAAAGEIVHVGSPREMTIADLARLAMRVAGLRGEIALHPAPAGSVRRRLPDIAKLRRLIGFTEKVSLEEGLARTAAYYLRRDVAHAAQR